MLLKLTNFLKQKTIFFQLYNTLLFKKKQRDITNYIN